MEHIILIKADMKRNIHHLGSEELSQKHLK